MTVFARIVTTIALAAVFASFCGATRHTLWADESLSRYYAGLRERGLFRLAESDCLRRLAGEQLTSGAQAELAIELSRTFAEHATYSQGHERDELWDRAGQVVDELRESDSAGVFRELLSAQRGFVASSRGAQLRWQFELFPLDERAREGAAEVLRRALAILEPLPDALDERMRNARDRVSSAQRNGDRPALSRFREVQKQVEYRTAAAIVDLAKVLPTGPDRAAAFDQADAALRALTKTPQPDAAAWRAQVLLIEVLRLRGNLDRVGPRASSLLEKNPPTGIRDAAVAQRVRADLDADRPDAALERLQTHRRTHGVGSGELQCLLVEALLAARRIAFQKQQPDLASDLLEQAASYATKATGAWGVRSRLLVETAREADLYGPVLADAVRQAKWAWNNGDLEGAIAAYGRAVSEAHQSARGEFAVDLALTMATLQTEARQFDGAVTTLTGLLENYPQSPRAAEAHLLRAYALGKQYEQRPDVQRRQAYRTALNEHRVKFADSPTMAEATWMLARLEEHARNWPEAARLLETIPVDNKRGEAAQARLAAVYDHALEEMRGRGEPTQDRVEQAIATLKGALHTFAPEPEPLTDSHVEVAFRLARLLLGQESPDFALADKLLERVLRKDQRATNAASAAKRQANVLRLQRIAAASQLRIVSLAGQGRLSNARDVLARIKATHPDHLLDVLTGLSAAAEQIAVEHRQTVGQLQWELAQGIEEQRDSLSPEGRLKLDECLAQAHAALGRYPQAAALYQKLLWQRPDDQRLIEALARMYESCGLTSCLRSALKQWQALERLQRKGTPEWVESRYRMAWCSHRIGDDESARKLISVTRLLYPELGNEELKARFAELAAELASPAGRQK